MTRLIGRNYVGIIRIGGRDTEQRFTQNRISLRNDVTRSACNWPATTSSRVACRSTS